MTIASEIPSRVRQLAAGLSVPKAMRRGSLSERTVKCSKPNCACGQDPKARHGPYQSLTRAVEGKTRSRFLTTQEAEIARQQIAAGQKFREQLDDYWEACEQWADAQLEGLPAASQEAPKKGALRPVPSRDCARNRSLLRQALDARDRF